MIDPSTPHNNIVDKLANVSKRENKVTNNSEQQYLEDGVK